MGGRGTKGPVHSLIEFVLHIRRLSAYAATYERQGVGPLAERTDAAVQIREVPTCSLGQQGDWAKPRYLQVAIRMDQLVHSSMAPLHLF